MAIADLVGRRDFDAEVVERAGDAGAAGPRLLNEHQLQRGVGHGEVGVAGLHLRRSTAEELRVEVNGLTEVGDVEGELDSGHGSSGTLTVIDMDSVPDRSMNRQYDTREEGGPMPRAAGAKADTCCPPITAGQLNDAEATELAALFAALSDPVRLASSPSWGAQGRSAAATSRVPWARVSPPFRTTRGCSPMPASSSVSDAGDGCGGVSYPKRSKGCEGHWKAARIRFKCPDDRRRPPCPHLLTRSPASPFST